MGPPDRTTPIVRVWWQLHDTLTRNHRCSSIDELLGEVFTWINADRCFDKDEFAAYATATWKRFGSVEELFSLPQPREYAAAPLRNEIVADCPTLLRSLILDPDTRRKSQPFQEITQKIRLIPEMSHDSGRGWVGSRRNQSPPKSRPRPADGPGSGRHRKRWSGPRTAGHRRGRPCC